MAPQVLHRVIYGTQTPQPWQKSLTTVRPALLLSHRRQKVKYADYPGVLPHPHSTVRGTFVTGLTDGDLWRLDIFEGSQYSRQKVSVRLLPENKELDDVLSEEEIKGSGNWESREAETYIWKAEPGELEDEEWDFEVFKKEKMRYWTGERQDEVDSGFGDVDRAVAENDGTGGRGFGGEISRELDRAH